jgi:imidazolonepropionase-like amidohydrolase
MSGLFSASLRIGAATITCVLLGAVPLPAAGDATFLLRGATIHTVSSAVIEHGDLLVRDGKIAGIGSKLSAPKGVRIIEARGLHVYPGIIDSATEIGLTEIGAVRETSDTNELGSLNPQLRAAVAVNPASEHIPVTRANGITSVMTLPQGTMLAGQAALIHLDGWTSEEMAFLPDAAMMLHFPIVQISRSRFSRANPATYPEARKNYEQQIRELEEFFEGARRYQKARQAHAPGFTTDLKFEAMLPLLEGKIPLMVEAVREKPIREAMRFAEKEKVRMVLAHGEEAWKVAPELKARNIPVILGPTLALPLDEDDPYDRLFTAPGELSKAGVKIAFGSFSSEFSRNLPYQAAAAVAFGLSHDEALKAITLYPAQIWGVADRIGSIEEGKWADLMVTDGDPLETPTQVKQLFIKGNPVDLDNKQKRLYEKYLNRP